MLAGIGRELSQQLAGRKDAADQGGSNPQDVRQLRTITPSRILLPVNPIRGFGTRLGAKTCSRFDGRSRMRGMNR